MYWFENWTGIIIVEWCYEASCLGLLNYADVWCYVGKKNKTFFFPTGWLKSYLWLLKGVNWLNVPKRIPGNGFLNTLYYSKQKKC